MLRRFAVATAAFAAMMLAGSCASAPGGRTGADASPREVRFIADYVGREWPAIARDAAVVAQGRVVAREAVVVPPDGGEPRRGLSDDELAAAVFGSGVVGTEMTFEVDEVFRGDVAPGDRVVFSQTGAELPTFRYVSDEVPLLDEGIEYLVFLEAVDDVLVFHPGAVYLPDEAGGWTARHPGYAPLDPLTPADLAAALA
jgi:hypothetical protein